MDISPNLIRGHIDTMILAVLTGGRKYGYEIFKELLAKGGRDYGIKEPTLYSALKRLEDGREIVSEWGREEDARRKFYRITEEGKFRYGENRREWEYAKSVIDKLI